MTQQWFIYNDAKANVWKGRFDLNGGHTLKVALYLSTSDCADVAYVGATYSAFSHELGSGNGYSSGGAALTTPAITGGGAVADATFDTDDWTLAITGSGITARWAVIYDDDTGYALAYGPLSLDGSNNPQNLTVAAGNTLRLLIAGVLDLL